MVELVLFIGGMLMAWAAAGLFCAERQRRLHQIEQTIAEQRAAAAAAAKRKPRPSPPQPSAAAQPPTAKAA